MRAQDATLVCLRYRCRLRYEQECHLLVGLDVCQMFLNE